ncbi:MAG: 23S rRNA (uridine(2552)-2'-O)-methyltransferase RlmE [Porticoccaceae bacterium]
MARSKSSGRWLREHESDSYVLRARKDGYRSRASYKLIDLDAKDKLLRPGMKVVDLGAAPGGWSQVAAAKVGRGGRVVAFDILPMAPIEGIDFIRGDFTEESALAALVTALDNSPVDLVISDMSPNITGLWAVDQPRVLYLVELALDFAAEVLAPGGCFVAKVFQGEGSDQLRGLLRQRFTSVASRKPDASRARSREVYWVAKGFRATPRDPGI